MKYKLGKNPSIDETKEQHSTCRSGHWVARDKETGKLKPISFSFLVSLRIYFFSSIKQLACPQLSSHE